MNRHTVHLLKFVLSECISYCKHPFFVVASKFSGVPRIEQAGKVMNSYIIMSVDIKAGTHFKAEVTFGSLHIVDVMDSFIFSQPTGIRKFTVECAFELDLKIRTAVYVPPQFVEDVEVEGGHNRDCEHIASPLSELGIDDGIVGTRIQRTLRCERAASRLIEEAGLDGDEVFDIEVGHDADVEARAPGVLIPEIEIGIGDGAVGGIDADTGTQGAELFGFGG